MNKRTVRAIMVILILLTICLYFVSGTYARYASSLTGNAKLEVAQWAVAFTDGNAALQNNFDLTFTVQNNTNVVSGKIAPASTATATIKVDLTGTEVAVDYKATVTDTDLATFFGLSADKVTVTTTATVNGQPDSTGTIALIDDAAFTASNGIVEITISITWENDDAYNESDTTLGIAAGTLELPVTITLEQHID